MKTGVQKIYNCSKRLDSGLRRNDRKAPFLTFYEFIKHVKKDVKKGEGMLRLCYRDRSFAIKRIRPHSQVKEVGVIVFQVLHIVQPLVNQ